MSILTFTEEFLRECCLMLNCLSKEQFTKLLFILNFVTEISLLCTNTTNVRVSQFIPVYMIKPLCHCALRLTETLITVILQLPPVRSQSVLINTRMEKPEAQIREIKSPTEDPTAGTHMFWLPQSFFSFWIFTIQNQNDCVLHICMTQNKCINVLFYYLKWHS